MLGLRPKTSNLYLERPRLLKMFPQEAGYVVWLEAPYGYGKSVLAMQWAEELELENWRLLWLSLERRDTKTSVAELLGLPAFTPWGILKDELWKVPSLLVLEDLTGEEGLSPLLKNMGGLILLASRKKLNYEVIPRLMIEGRLLHLTAKQLAFTHIEAKELFADKAHATKIWKQTQGWSLPLHFSALTGEPPERQALLEGMQASLSQEAWQEAMFLSTIPFLPREAANEGTNELVKTGFVQSLEDGFRLHPMMAEAILTFHPDKVKLIVATEAKRLPILLRGNAFEKVKDEKRLEALLADNSLKIQRLGAEQAIRWANFLEVPLSATAKITVGDSLCSLDKIEEGIVLVQEAIDSGELEPNTHLKALGNVIWHLAFIDQEKARLRINEGEKLLNQVSNDIAAGFYSDISVVGHVVGDHRKALDYLEKGLELASPTSSQYVGLVANRNIILWEVTGSLEKKMTVHEDREGLAAKHFPDQITMGYRDLVRDYINLGKGNEARRYIQLIQEDTHPKPHARLETRAMQAFLDADPEPFSGLLIEAKAWELDYQTPETILYFWLKTLRYQEDLETFENVMNTYPEIGLDVLERAVYEAQKGKRSKAMERLSSFKDHENARIVKLYWQAAKYLITREIADLDELISLTTVKEHILPGLIRVEELPKERPELCKFHPLKEILFSSWPEAIKYRFNEIPDLEITCLGGLTVKLLGEEQEVTKKQKELLALLLLGYGREAIGEAMWPEVKHRKMRNNLNVLLNTLRKALEPWNIPTYLLPMGLVRTQVDLWQLQTALKEKDSVRVNELYNGPFAPGIDLPLINAARDELKHDVITLLLEATKTESENQQLKLETVLRIDPLNENALQLLLTKLIKQGRRVEAKKRYLRFAKQLSYEMKLEPLEETRDILS